MPLPFFHHVGHSGGNSFFRAIGVLSPRDDVLIVNSKEEMEQALPRVQPESAMRIIFALGHAIHLAKPWFPDRYELTMLRRPVATFCADNVYYHEHPAFTAELPEVFGIADPHARLRAHLDHLEQGGRPALWTLVHWLDVWHKLGCEAFPRRAERLALVERCDGLLRDYYHLVGITELMDETLFLFQVAFPDWKVAPWVRNRVNKQRIDPFNLPPDIVSRFEREYEADIALYDRARQRLLARFSAFLHARPEIREHYVAYKTAMILTDAVLMARFAEGDPLYFPPELPLEQLRASVVSQLDRAHEIRANIMRAYG